MSRLYFDNRWCAPHGIGRFATEVRRRLGGFDDISIEGSPTGRLDALRLANFLSGRKASGYFSPGFNVPAWAKCPVITTIHDLIHIHDPSERTWAKAAYYRFVQRPVVRQAPVTLTVSEYSRQQIVQWYGVPESKVVCVGNGVSESFTPDGRTAPAERPFFLYVGNIKPHKNVTTLLTAMSQVATKCDATLVMVSKPDARLRRQVAESSLEGKVTFMVGLDDPQLASLYRAATALVLPSRWEGFGLPLVEAMSCGCPVIGSNRTAIPEVLGGAGELFDPDQPEALVEKMMSLFEDSMLRVRLREQGLVRADAFNWDRVADKIRQTITPHLAG